MVKRYVSVCSILYDQSSIMSITNTFQDNWSEVLILYVITSMDTILF